MTPEEKSLLLKTHELAEDNNRILRSMRRANRWSIALRVAYWVFIIVIGFGAFYFIQPYIEMMTGLMKGAGGITDTYTNAVNAADTLRDLLK